jgi:hypothetical protein
MFEETYICGTLPGCNADYIVISGNMRSRYRPFDTFGGLVRQEFVDNLTAKLKKFKTQGKTVYIEIFNALGFREKAADGRESGGKNTVWETDEYVNRRDAFFSRKGWRMQKRLIKTVIRVARESGCKFKISFMWEAQTLGKDPRFIPWLKKCVKLLHKHKIKAGVHSHVVSHYQVADFVIYEGNFAKYLHLWDLKKPVYCLRRNRGKFNPRKKAENFKEATAEPFPRYMNQRTLNREIGKNNFNCEWFKGKISEFILNVSKELKKYHNKELPFNFGQEFVYRIKKREESSTNQGKESINSELQSESEQKKEEDKEKNIKTAPLEIVEPEREEEMKNFNLWKSITKYTGRWWHHVIVGGILFTIISMLAWFKLVSFIWTPVIFIMWSIFSRIVERIKVDSISSSIREDGDYTMLGKPPEDKCLPE